MRTLPEICPDCGAMLEAFEPCDAEPDTGIRESAGGVHCPHCGYIEEYEAETPED